MHEALIIFAGNTGTMDIIWKATLILLTGSLGIWKGVPAGLALGFHWGWVWVLVSAGALLAAALLCFGGGKVIDMIKSRLSAKGKKNEKALRLYKRYGIPGLGLLGTLIFGPNLTVIIGISLPGSRVKLFLYTAIGIVVWTLLLSVSGGSVARWLTG
ncbi:MAG: hypothetical protein Kow00127_19440 [Bacteroidales bacterium]